MHFLFLFLYFHLLNAAQFIDLPDLYGELMYQDPDVGKYTVGQFFQKMFPKDDKIEVIQTFPGFNIGERWIVQEECPNVIAEDLSNCCVKVKEDRKNGRWETICKPDFDKIWRIKIEQFSENEIAFVRNSQSEQWQKGRVVNANERPNQPKVIRDIDFTSQFAQTYKDCVKKIPEKRQLNDCPGHHGLKTFGCPYSLPENYCDNCLKPFATNSKFHGCRICNFDLCDECAPKKPPMTVCGTSDGRRTTGGSTGGIDTAGGSTCGSTGNSTNDSMSQSSEACVMSVFLLFFVLIITIFQ
jgi:hypothetical protein